MSFLSTNHITQLLSHIHKMPPVLSWGWRLSYDDVTTLCQRIGRPIPAPPLLQDAPILQAHLLIASAAQLITQQDNALVLTPAAFTWLQAPPDQQYQHIKEHIDTHLLYTAIEKWHLEPYSDSLFVTWVRQQWQLHPTPILVSPPYGTLISFESQIDIQLHEKTPAQLLFDLVQFTDWVAPTQYTITPLSLQQALHIGIPLQTVRSTLFRLQNSPLSHTLQQQIEAWAERLQFVRITYPTLLHTETEEEMQAIRQQRHLKKHIDTPITPRHALVDDAIIPPLRRHLAKQNVRLNVPLPIGDHASLSIPDSPDPVVSGIALQTLIHLSQYIDLSLHNPQHTLNTLLQEMTPQQQTAVQQHAQRLFDDLARVIDGTGSFQPAAPSAIAFPAAWRDIIDAAAIAQTPLTIHYQGIDDDQPRPRTITPIHIEQRGDLYYLIAHCHTGRADRTFRLDRITQLAPSQKQ